MKEIRDYWTAFADMIAKGDVDPAEIEGMRRETRKHVEKAMEHQDSSKLLFKRTKNVL